MTQFATPKDATRDIERVFAGERIVFEYPAVADAGFATISGFLFRLLARFDLAFLSEITLVALKEIISNCSKANGKRIFFDERKLDINNLDEYARGMRLFSEEALAAWETFRKRAAVNKKYYIKLFVEKEPAALVFTIENNVQVHPIEWDRIRKKIQSYRTHRDLNRAFAEIRDESEGAGLGIFLVMSLLENAGIPPDNYRLVSKGGLTTNEIRIPMPIAADSFRKDFYQQALAEVNSLPSFPENISHLLNLCESDTASVQLIAQQIQKDPALTAQVLKIVNSAGYLRYNRTPGLEEAVKVIGLKVIRNLLMVTGARTVLSGHYRIKDLETIWEDSNRVSNFARRLVRGKPQTADLVTVAGLLFELGKISLMALKPDVVKLALRAQAAGRVRSSGVIEESMIGISHPEIGAHMGERWNFPEPLVVAIRYQQRPLAAPEKYAEAVCAMYLAIAINNASLGQGGYWSVEPEILEQFGVGNQAQFDRMVQEFVAGYTSGIA